jgi:hypothetical protein
MSSNPTPENNDILRALADRLADGCHQHEQVIGIKQNTETVIRANITALAQAELQVGLKKSAVSDGYDALQAADAAGEEVLVKCKLRLQGVLGQKWSAAWSPTGFPTGSVAIPKSQDERFTLLDSLKNYFTAVPANESEDMGATAAICEAAWTTLSNARQALANAESAQTTAFTNRTNAENSLRKRVRGLIDELDGLIAADDPRWEDFGLNIPANPSAPQSVASVSVTQASNHRLEVTWPYAVRAMRYIIEIFIVGLDTEWRTGATSKDLTVILKNLTAGQTVKARVVAVNDGGKAAPSPEAQETVA